MKPQELSFIVDGNAKCYGHPGRQFGSFLQKLNSLEFSKMNKQQTTDPSSNNTNPDKLNTHTNTSQSQAAEKQG